MAELTEEDADEMENREGVIAVEEDIIVTGSMMTKKKNNVTFPLADNKVKIALIDSGVDATSEINVVERVDLISPDMDINPVYEDMSGHGTAIAGVIASSGEMTGVAGINPNVEIYSARVLDGENKAPMSRVLEGIYWAIEKKVDIISISFGTQQYSQALEMAIQEADKQGILIVAAAGNTGKQQNGRVEYPAAFENVMAVGAVDTEGKRCESSATGEELDIMAPGEQICSTGAFGGVMVSSGTSLAVPHVVGAASVLWEKDKSVSSDFIRALLEASANNTGTEKEYGEGIVDLQYALDNYDSFKETYKKRITEGEEKALDKATDTVDENVSEIEKFSDVDYVEGSWKLIDHLDIVDKESGGIDLTGSQIKLIKIGAILPDLMYPGFQDGEGVDIGKRVYAHPYCHGYYNYLASYIYTARVAWQVYHNENKKYDAIFDLKATKWNTIFAETDMYGVDWASKIKGDLRGLNWSNLTNNKKPINNVIRQNGLYTSALNNLNNRNKSYIILGMAVHIATDVFSHRSMIDPDGDKVYVPYGHLECDEWSKYPKRYICASVVASSAIFEFAYGNKASLWDFYIGYRVYAGNSFRLSRMLRYAKQTTKKLDSNLEWDFKFINYISKNDPN